MEHTIGMHWEQAKDMDWGGFYPVVDQETHKIVAVIPARLATAEDQEADRLYTFDEDAEIYWSRHPLTEINQHLARIGVTSDNCGEYDSVVASVDREGRVRFADDQESTTLPMAAALARLQSIPDGAGWVAFWEAM